ncbi:MAG: Holliday junction branch migration protein RuvA [Actinomycetota bacterium]
MISFLEGELAEKLADRVVLDVGGVGYEVLVPVSTLAKLPPVGRRTRVFTRLHVREDAMVLFGFCSSEERHMFDLLTGVSGIGPKLALAVLSVHSPDGFRRALAGGDVAALATVPGVGRKTAGRIVVDLRDKLGAGDDAVSGPLSEVREALLALGLTPGEASDAMEVLAGRDDGSTEELLRKALQSVGR